MWISKKKWKELEKRVTDLECRVQGRSINSKLANLDESARQKREYLDLAIKYRTLPKYVKEHYDILSQPNKQNDA